MSLNDDISILGRVGLFKSFTDEQLRLLAFGAERFTLRAGHELFREGQDADCAYVIVSGSVSLYYEESEGRRIVRSVGESALLGEIALIMKTTRQMSAITNTETEIIRLSHSIFSRILEMYPDVAKTMHTYIKHDFIGFVRRIEKLSPFFDE